MGMSALLKALAFSPADVVPAKVNFEEWERSVKSKRRQGMTKVKRVRRRTRSYHGVCHLTPSVLQYPDRMAPDRAQPRPNQEFLGEIPQRISHCCNGKSCPTRKGWPTLHMTRRDPALLLLARCSEHQFSSKTARPKPFTSCKAVEPFLGGDHPHGQLYF